MVKIKVIIIYLFFSVYFHCFSFFFFVKLVINEYSNLPPQTSSFISYEKISDLLDKEIDAIRGKSISVAESVFNALNPCYGFFLSFLFYSFVHGFFFFFW
jgi:hypothetical protein